MTDWRIFYSDGTVHDSDDPSDWDGAPTEEVYYIEFLDKGAAKALTRIRWTAFYYKFFFMLPSDNEPIASNDLVPTVYRLGLTPQSPFPDDPRAYLRSQGVLQHFKFAGAWSVKEDLAFISEKAHNDVDFARGTSPSRRSTD